jgi:hypothetical protein
MPCSLQDTLLRCLLPEFIALTCPQLTQLRVIKSNTASMTEKLFSRDPAQALPLSVCSSLKQLAIDNDDGDEETGLIFELPAAHHSQAELRHSLPNIDTLIMRCSNETLIQAFATQLTRLEISEDAAIVQQSIHMCSNLQHLKLKHVILPEKADSLTMLDVARRLTDDDLGKILQLPNLSKLSCDGFCLELKQDWSSHACTWQELHVNRVPMEITKLCNLNLRGVKKMSMYGDQVSMTQYPSCCSITQMLT